MLENSPYKRDAKLISVIIPFYNPGDFFREAIESVFAQTIDRWELILINDGSSDQSVETAREFEKRYPDRVIVLAHDRNLNKGASTSRHLGVSKAKGEFLTFLDADDVLFPETLETELRTFAENPEADAVCGVVECWFSWSEGAGSREKDFMIDLGLITERLYLPPDLLVHNLRAGGRKPHPNCIAVKTRFAREIEVFQKDYEHSLEDHVAWSKLALNGSIYLIDAVLAKYRVHSNSTSASEMESGQHSAARTIFLDWLEDYLADQDCKDKEVWRAFKSFRRKAVLDSRFDGVKKIYRRIVPLHIRYKIRDQLTRAKGILSWPTHRHK